MPLLTNILGFCAGLSSESPTISYTTEQETISTSASWVVILFYVLWLLIFVSAIPLFITGLVRANRTINVMQAKSIDSSSMKSKRSRLIVFFILCLVLPIVNIVFWILLLVTRIQIEKETLMSDQL